jgi:hypothetical protein
MVGGGRNINENSQPFKDFMKTFENQSVPYEWLSVEDLKQKYKDVDLDMAAIVKLYWYNYFASKLETCFSELHNFVGTDYEYNPNTFDGQLYDYKNSQDNDDSIEYVESAATEYIKSFLNDLNFIAELLTFSNHKTAFELFLSIGKYEEDKFTKFDDDLDLADMTNDENPDLNKFLWYFICKQLTIKDENQDKTSYDEIIGATLAEAATANTNAVAAAAAATAAAAAATAAAAAVAPVPAAAVAPAAAADATAAAAAAAEAAATEVLFWNALKDKIEEFFAEGSAAELLAPFRRQLQAVVQAATKFDQEVARLAPAPAPLPPSKAQTATQTANPPATIPMFRPPPPPPAAPPPPPISISQPPPTFTAPPAPPPPAYKLKSDLVEPDEKPSGFTRSTENAGVAAAIFGMAAISFIAGI